MATLPGRHPVYNLEVEDCHEYVANGVLVHNCTFPAGKHDDIVDACSGAFNRLALAGRPSDVGVVRHSDAELALAGEVLTEGVAW